MKRIKRMMISITVFYTFSFILDLAVSITVYRYQPRSFIMRETNKLFVNFLLGDISSPIPVVLGNTFPIIFSTLSIILLPHAYNESRRMRWIGFTASTFILIYFSVIGLLHIEGAISWILR